MDILRARLSTQLLCGAPSTPEAVVDHMICLQAQDFTQVKWAIASRSWGDLEIIHHSFNAWAIVRTWTQRGTIHVVSADDARWMVQLCAAKTLGWFKKRREYLGLDDLLLPRIQEVVTAYLTSWPKSRRAIGAYLEESGISLQKNWIYHILCYLGTLGVVVQWPVAEKEHLFALADLRLPQQDAYHEDEMLEKLVLRYFTSHGPATIADLQRWSGLGVTQIKKGIALCGRALEAYDGYYVAAWLFDQLSAKKYPKSVHFLAGYDEWLLGYKDRTATLHLDHHTRVDASRNGVFKPTVMIDGNTIGIWSVNHKSTYSEVVVTLFETVESWDRAFLWANIDAYAAYLWKEVRVHIA